MRKFVALVAAGFLAAALMAAPAQATANPDGGGACNELICVFSGAR